MKDEKYKKYLEDQKKNSDPKTHGLTLIPELDIEIGLHVVWFYPPSTHKDVIIASEIIGDDDDHVGRVRIDHINRDNTTREGGYVNVDELYTKDIETDEDGYVFITNFWPLDLENSFTFSNTDQTVEEYEADLRRVDGWTEFKHKTPYTTDGVDLSIQHPHAIAIWGKKIKDATTEESI